MSDILNVSMKKVGGIRFLKLGRITISLSVTSWEAIERKLEADLVKAVDLALWHDAELYA